MLNHYRVTWEIDVDALSAEQAAYIARAMQLMGDSWATVFTVRDEVTGEVTEVDLLDKEST